MPEPGGLLGEIVRRKRRDLGSQLSGLSLESLRNWAPRSGNSLASALARPGARFILEVKRASPSQGVLAAGADPALIASEYRSAADAVSVLTDGPYFKGSLDDLSRARAGFDGPLLAKDFIIDPRQVVEARLHGADAVLVMLSVLTPDEARLILREADLFGMDVLVEVHDETELGQAIDLGARLIGINNRDLRSFKVDLGVTERLAPRVPSDRILVAESGIQGRSDVERLAPFADAFLVGSALMRSASRSIAARELVFGRVKVCGLTTAEDARAAADCGATHGGVVLVPGSPRAIRPKDAGPVVAAIRERGVRTAGIFRNEKLMDAAMTSRALGLDIVQLHGEEDSSYIAALRSFLGDHTEIWAASGAGRDPPRPREGADRTVFDSLVNGRTGGTGRTFDWSRLDRRMLGTSVLAGGLNPTNARAAAGLGAWALDVGSGVEAEPGRKDMSRLESFFQALRPPARAGNRPCS